jgi:hypothetical protein
LPNGIEKIQGPGGVQKKRRERKLALFMEKQCTTTLKEIFYKRIDLFLDNILGILYPYNIPGMRIVPIVALTNVLHY